MRNLSRRFRHLAPPAGWDPSQGCHILGCGRSLAAHGLCWAHLQRVYRCQPVYVYLRVAGTLVRTAHVEPWGWSRRERRIARIRYEIETNWTPDPNTGCHLWLGKFAESGYSVAGATRDPWGGYAHRAVLFFAGVPLEHSHSKHVRHICGQPACVNPAHLVYGTAKENMADRELHIRLGMKTRRRTVRVGRPVLTIEQAREAKARLALGERQSVIARSLGVRWGVIYNLAHGLSWKSLQVKGARVAAA